MPTTVRFNPYNIASDLVLHVEDAFDPTEEDRHVGLEMVVNATGHQPTLDLEFEDPDREWKSLTLSLRASLPARSLTEILPRTTNPRTETSLVVTAQCSATRLRRAVFLESDGAGGWRGTFNIRKASVRNVVTLVPRLVRNSYLPPSGETQDRLAHDRHAVIAEGRPVNLRVDGHEPSVKGALDVKWEDFRGSNHPWRKNHPSDIYSVDVSGILPTVWLNARYASLRAALHGGEQNGPDAILRHSMNVSLAQAIWHELFWVAAGDLERDPESGLAVRPTGWKGEVLDALLPRILPDRSDHLRLEELAEMLSTPGQKGNLVTRLGSAIQDAIAAHRHLEDAIKASESHEFHGGQR